ncbi:hypothetical protein CEXT_695261 [Caerostris extrusa]|uniref:Uncharacterized protein n=1 Tax=Caerostris extrusa TaxID=172846 RepID=A0AAV4URK7_CAEEX|nr:hypothetical protein CEXT_695261 [Caerostris extrusa]
MGGQKIKYNRNLKYLGIIIDKKLNWNPHLEYVGNKVSKIFQKLNRTTRVHWGLTPMVKKNSIKGTLKEDIQIGDTAYRAENLEEDTVFIAPGTRLEHLGGTSNRWKEVTAFTQTAPKRNTGLEVP